MKKERKKHLKRLIERAREREERKHPSVTGKLSMTNSGFGFVTPDHANENVSDVFIPAQFINGAIDGDTVKVTLLPPRDAYHEADKGPAGRIVEIIGRNREEFVGELLGGRKVRPFSRKLPAEIQLTGVRKGAKRGDWVNFKLLGSDHGEWFGQISGRIGKAGEIAGDLDAVMAEYHLPRRYNEEDDAAATSIRPREIAREDHTKEFVFTLDPFDAKDFDDALSLTPGETPDTVIIGVHISDVAAYIAPRSHFDKAAAKRGFSCYLPGRTLPMLPPALTAKISLQANQKSLAHSVFLTVEKKTGKVVSSRRVHTEIQVSNRLNYEEVQQFFDTGKAPGKWDAAVLETIDELHRITQSMRRWRQKNEGFIDLEIPEIRILCEENANRILGLVRKLPRESEALVEECMLAANTAVGTELGEKGIAGLYRVHPAPDPEKVAEFSTMAETVFGITPGDLTDRTCVNAFLKKIPDDPRKPVILGLLLRTMARAGYQAKPGLHFGLGKGRYSHFTSPIRRYPDLVTHQQLWNFDCKERLRAGSGLEKVAESCCELEENSDAAYFAATDRLKLRYLQEQLEKGGENCYEGVIAKVSAAGLQVDILELGLYGFVPRENLHGEQRRSGFSFRSKRGESSYKPGDFIYLRLENVDFAGGSAIFALAGR